jgi:peptide/nickel transport system permease protein
VIIGAASGYFGGWIDLLLQRLVEIMMCFPTFILILTVVAAVGHDIFIIMMVIGLTSWAGTARLVRGEFLAQAVRDYVTAVESIGVPRWRIMFRHILPNTMAPIVITATFGVAGAVLGESGLSFLGLGDPTTPSWGLLLDEGRENIDYAWLIYAPGVAIFVLVTSLNLIGNGLRDAFDPKSP